MSTEMSTCGNWSSEELVTPEVEKICREVKSDIEKKVGDTFKAYIPLSFKSQIVNGTNYLVKVYVDVEKCVRAMISAALPCNGGKLTVNEAQKEPLSAPLVPF